MSLRSLAHRLDSEGVGVCLDVGHAHIVAEQRHTSLEMLVAPMLDVVTLFHAHDNFGARRGYQHGDALGVDPLRLDLHLPPGRGSVPWHAIGPLIAAHSAPVVLEVHPPYRPRAAELREDAAVLLGAG
jgi:sugar phosphate isomerase/epimerase